MQAYFALGMHFLVDFSLLHLLDGGAFGLSDLMQIISKLNKTPRDSEEEIREAFRVFDRDGRCLPP